MAIRQYIGARYVLKIYENSQDPQSADWEAGVVYEPLVMVNYQNSSYISRKTVPANIGNPVANPSYWALSGLYNGQIAALQRLINEIGDRVTELEVTNDYSKSKIMLITDSYGLRTNASGKYINEIVQSLIPGSIVGRLAVGGAGMADGEFITPINNYDSTQAAQYDIVVYVGGANDMSQAALNPALIPTGIDNFWSAVKNKFVNAKKFYTYGCGVVFHQYSTYYRATYRSRVAEQYFRGAIRNGAIYIKNAEYILRNSTLLESDRTHPNNAGVDEISRQLVEGLKTGGVHVHYEMYVQGTNLHDPGTTPAGANFWMIRDNGTVRIAGAGGSGRFYMSTENILCNGQSVELAELPDTLIDVNENSHSFNTMGTAFDGTNNVTVRSGLAIWKNRDDASTKIVARISAPYGSVTGLLQIDGTGIWID